MNSANDSSGGSLSTHVPRQEADGSKDLDSKADENDCKTASSEVDSPAEGEERVSGECAE